MHIIETRDLDHVYPDGTQALKGVNFEAHRNEIVAVIGANGAGKTTLFKHFNGLLKPSSGRVLIQGEEIGKDNLLQVRKTVGLVFQNPDDQLFAPSVWQDVAFGPMNLGLAAEVVEHRVREALEMVGMSGFEERAPHHLSYGQKKRVAIAGILAMEPHVMVMDEPTSGLDPGGVAKIVALLQRLRELGMSTIIATHDVDIVPAFADRVYLLHHGQVALEGTPEEVFASEMIEESHLRLPYVAQLLKDLKDEGYDLGTALTIGEARKELLRLLGD
ncbi:MAG: ATP-binding cassette domain-containing protein [Euryarchaeota archaeon]|nr:ATP-binding cassette domain-containing protein [Euryarchaeota archaeon]